MFSERLSTQHQESTIIIPDEMGYSSSNLSRYYMNFHISPPGITIIHFPNKNTLHFLSPDNNSCEFFAKESNDLTVNKKVEQFSSS